MHLERALRLDEILEGNQAETLFVRIPSILAEALSVQSTEKRMFYLWICDVRQTGPTRSTLEPKVS